MDIDNATFWSPTFKLCPAVNEKAYEHYGDEYIKRLNTPQLPLWQVFSEYVQREFL